CGRGRSEEVHHRIPQQVPVLAVAQAVRGLRQDDELAVAVRQLTVEVEQVVVGRVAVVFAAQHQHWRLDLGRVDQRQIDGHVEIGDGRYRVALLYLVCAAPLSHRQ